MGSHGKACGKVWQRQTIKAIHLCLRDISIQTVGCKYDMTYVNDISTGKKNTWDYEQKILEPKDQFHGIIKGN